MKKIAFVFVSIFSIIALSGCGLFNKTVGDLNNNLKGKTMTIQTFDEDANIIDQIIAKSVSFKADNKFAQKDSEGNTISKSSVINMTIGGKETLHVGSSLIGYQKGLTNIFDEYTKRVDIRNNDRSVPFVNRMVNDMKNLTAGKKTIILIRSQSGKPIATFAGNDVSYFASEIDKATEFYIDGKILLVYRCDFSVYEKDLLK